MAISMPSPDPYGKMPEESERPSISVVIPAINEEKNLPWILRRIPHYVDEVVLVDRGSSDETVRVARALRNDVVVVNEQGQGLGVALRHGFAAATGDILVILEADGSMDPQEVGFFVGYIENNFDFVKGSRYVTGGGSEDLTRLRSVGNRALTHVANGLLRIHCSDLCYGYMAFRRECLQVLPLESVDSALGVEFFVKAAKTGFRIAEVPSLELDRISGSSHIRLFREGWQVLQMLLRVALFWDPPTGGQRPESLLRVKRSNAYGGIPSAPRVRDELLNPVALPWDIIPRGFPRDWD